MDRHVEVAPTILANALILTRTNAEERSFAVCIAVAQSAPQKPVVVVDPEAGVCRGAQDKLKFVAKGVVNVFIGVEEEPPRRLDLVIPEVPVALLWGATTPAEVDPVCTSPPSNSFGKICRTQIHHNDLCKAPEVLYGQVPTFRSSLRIGATTVTGRNPKSSIAAII